jgi:acyl carrier protein
VRSVKTDLPFLGLSIRDRVQKFIEERFLAGAGLDRIQPDESLLENGIMDSTGVIELIDFLEETFNTKIMDEEVVPDNLDSINKVVAFIERKTGPKTG